MSSGPVRRAGPRLAAVTVEVTAPDRARDAHLGRLSGEVWSDIAERTGYVSGRVAAAAVDAWLQKTAVELGRHHRREALRLELARLDRLQAAFWDRAMVGDYHAAEVLLKVSARRCKVLGLDKPDDSASAPRTVVIGGNSDEYIAGLKAVMDGTA